jgi:cellulose synthase/poly-beta-1,6-N-acetylglucosamine synthase-like glycosyltransferase
MANRLEDRIYGGCQGAIDGRATDARVRRYLGRSGMFSMERILEDTVHGSRNIYPWILSGNCMYRRAAIAEAGSFNEDLVGCEDVDLAWRVVLQGYMLGYVPGAAVVHYDVRSWHRFLAKGRVYGAGAAQLAHVYREHGARNKFVPHNIWGGSVERSMASWNYWLGYYGGSARTRLGLRTAIPGQPVRPVHARFRPRFNWTETEMLQISRNCIFWFRDEQHSSVLVFLPTKTRVVLDSSADVIWRLLAAQSDKSTVINKLCGYFNVAPVTARSDLDEFIEELIDVGIVLRTPR